MKEKLNPEFFRKFSAHISTPSLLFKWLAAAAIVIVLLSLAFGFILHVVVPPVFLERAISDFVEKRTDFSLTMEKTQLSFFPKAVLELRGAKIWNKKERSEAPPILSVARVVCRLRVMPLLFKKVEFDKVQLEGMKVEWMLPGASENGSRLLLLEDADLVAENIRSRSWIKFSAEGKWLSGEKNAFFRGKVKTDFDTWNVDSLAIMADLHLGKLALANVAHWSRTPLSEQIDSGILDADVQLLKQGETSVVSAKVKSALDNLVYHLGEEKTRLSKPAHYTFDGEASFDLNNRVLSLKDAVLNSPVGEVKAKGMMDLVGFKLEDVQLTASSVLLDSLPNYLLPVAQIMPIGLGFSGESQAEFHLDGTMDQLHVGAKADLSNTLLTYSRYFVKPKLVPLTVATNDMVLKRGRELNGGVDLRMQEVKLKGSFVNFDWVSKVGELTFVTNLVSLGGFEQFLPTCSGYELGGNAKVFLNGKGDFEHLGKLVLMYHVGFNDVSVGSAGKVPLVAGLNGKIDVGPMDLETNGLRFEFGESHLEVQTKVFLQEGQQVVLRVQSPSFDIRKFVLNLEEVLRIGGFTPDKADWAGFDQTLSQIVPPDGKAENLTAEFRFEKGRLVIQAFDFDIYGGHVGARGWVDLPSGKTETGTTPPETENVTPAPAISAQEKPTFALDAELQNISLARMLRRDVAKPVEGNLFGAFHAEGKGFAKEDLQTQLKGSGSVSVTNGEFQTFDILGSLGAIAELSGLGQFVSGTTRFHDIRADFRVGNGKIQTDHVIVYSNDFDIDGSGEVDFDGNLNFRLDTVLSNDLSRKIDQKLKEEDRIGPIPLLLAGKLDAPSLRPDPSLIRAFVIDLASRKLGKVLADQDWFKKLALAEEKNQKDENSSEPAKEPGKNTTTAGMTLLETLFQKRE